MVMVNHWVTLEQRRVSGARTELLILMEPRVAMILGV